MAVVAGSRSSTGVNAAAFHDFARRGRGPQPGADAASPRRAARSCYPVVAQGSWPSRSKRTRNYAKLKASSCGTGGGKKKTATHPLHRVKK